MSSDMTPEQIAYAVYWRAFTPHLDLLPWDGLSAKNRAAWEAAAQAVLAQFVPKENAS
jgi:hypothetical protein